MNNSNSPWKALSLVSIIGLDLAVSTLISVWLGNKVDHYLGTSPWFVIIGIFIGITFGILMIIPIIKKFLGE
jgi:ATP synthase protein I